MLKNLTYVLLGNFVYQVASFFSIIYLSRVLGPEVFGILNFSVAVISYYTVFVTFSLDDFGILHVASNREQKNIITHVGNLLSLRITISIVCYLVLIVSVYLIPQLYNHKKLLLIIGLNLFILAFNIEWVFIAIEKMQYAAISKSLSRLLYLLLILVLIKSSDDILLCAGINILTGFLVSSTLVFIFIRLVRKFKIIFNIQQWLYIIKYNLPLSISSIIGQIRMNADLVILGFLVTPYNMGLYAAILSLTNVGILFCGIVRQVIFSRIVKKYQNDDFEQLRIFNFLCLKYGIILGLIIGFYGTFFSNHIIFILFGSKFLEASLSLKIIIWVVAINFMGVSLPHLLMVHNRKLYLLVNLYAGVINIILNFALIPFIGIPGAAFSYLFSTLFWIAACYYNVCIRNKHLSLQLFEIIIKPIFSFILCSISIYYMNFINNYIAIIFSTVIYITILFITKYLSFHEIKSDLQTLSV